jgi:type I restriction enzyme S subunit
MVIDAEIQKGFKVTDFGLIPEGWHLHLIQTLIDERYILGHLDGNHGELYPRSHEFKDMGVPYIGATDFASGIINFSKCKFLSEKRALEFRKGIAKDGDVLFAHNATVGPVSLLQTDLDYVILSTTATYFRCNPEKLINHYLLYALQSKFFVKQYQSVMAQSTRFQVPITTQRKFFLVLPPIEEQTAIATTLSDTDALIENLEKLITKKRNIKQGAMQELLTGKKRLAGYDGKWEVMKLGEIVEVIMGQSPKSEFYNTSGLGLPLIQGNADVENRKTIIRTYTSNITKKGKKGATIMSVRAPVGEISKATFDCCLGRGVCAISYRNDYLYHFLIYFEKSWASVSTGSTFDSVNSSQVKNLEIPIPVSEDEQTIIAIVFNDMDTEIEALEQKLHKYRMIKQGMMQVLLTGKIRLI